MKQFFCFLLLLPGIMLGQQYGFKKDIRYYPASQYQDNPYTAQRCVLDIYFPKDIANYATVVWLHGGGLTGGSKFIPDELKGKGIAVVAVGYRLSPEVKAVQCIEDGTAAVAWTLSHIKEYGGDPGKVFVSGHSAGGYIALMLGLDKHYLAKYGADANSIAGLIPLSPQCITHFTIRKERGIPERQPVVDEFAPLYHVRADGPPLLLITGDRELELLGRYEENAYMARMMKLAGHKETRLIELGGYDHIMDKPAYPLILKEVERVLALKE